MNAPLEVLPPDANLRAPKRALPPGTVDTHAHIFDHFDRYPLTEHRKYQPPLCTREAWMALHASLGVAKGVQVHGSPYGFDNSITEDFIREYPGRFAGIANVHAGMDMALLKRLDAAGFRGARLMDQYASAATTKDLDAIARLVAPLGWHLEINIERSADWVDLEPKLRACPVPIVFDHIGRVRGSEGIDAPGFKVVRRILEARDDAWTKVSSWYRLSDAGPPYFDDMRPLVRAVIETRPDRCVWATNWPHPGLTQYMPNDADLVDLLDSWLPGDAVRAPLYATNAAKLYRL